MSEDPSQRHFIELWLNSVDAPLVFPVAEAAWGRFRRSLLTRKSGFFIFATLDGRTLALNLKCVRLARVWSEADDEVGLASGGGPDVTLHYAGRPAVSFQVAVPVDLARIFTSLKPLTEDQTLTFNDIDGKLVLLRANELMLLETNTVFVEEGYKQIYLQERGTLPPS